jgi:hypothetical protein
MKSLTAAMRAARDPNRSKHLAVYFDAPGSRFSGLTAVAAQGIARGQADGFPLEEMLDLLASRVPEYRYVATP